MTNRRNNCLPLPPLPLQKRRRVGRMILCFFLALLTVLVGTYTVLFLNGKLALRKDSDLNLPEDLADIYYDGAVVCYNGEYYRLNKNAVNILFLGVDKADLYEESTLYGKNGQADTIFVLSFDVTTGKIRILPVSRETMSEVRLYSSSGKSFEITQTQICLAYAYGTSNAESCKNAAWSVSRLLYGMEFSAVVSIDLSGVGVMTDAVGGVQVTALETIGNFKENAAVKLTGENALSYVRLRGSDLESNNRRMERQKQFISAFASRVGNQLLRSGFTKLGTYYNTAKPYVYTDISLADATYIAGSCLTSDVGNEILYNSIAGTLRAGKHTEFYPDETSLFEAVLNTFYLKVA